MATGITLPRGFRPKRHFSHFTAKGAKTEEIQGSYETLCVASVLCGDRFCSISGRSLCNSLYSPAIRKSGIQEERQDRSSELRKKKSRSVSWARGFLGLMDRSWNACGRFLVVVGKWR